MSLDVVSNGCELSATHILADVRHSLLHAARHMVAAIRHASDNGILLYYLFILEGFRELYEIFVLTIDKS